MYNALWRMLHCTDSLTGTGKSVLLREIVKMLRERGTKVAITATTGVAGVNIGGSTIHSFAGIRLGKEDVDILVKRLRGTKKYRKRWRKTRVLIIDEGALAWWQR